MSDITEDELLDVVDENDAVIGKDFRSRLYKDHSTSFRVINVFLMNDKGQLWIPRRSADKRLFPLCLDLSVGGHVGSGESYDEAMRREVSEEINLDIDSVSWKSLGFMNPQAHGVSAFMKVYEIRTNSVPPFNRDDFIEYQWLYPHEVLEVIKVGDRAKGDLPKIVTHYYLSNGENDLEEEVGTIIANEMQAVINKKEGM